MENLEPKTNNDVTITTELNKVYTLTIIYIDKSIDCKKGFGKYQAGYAFLTQKKPTRSLPNSVG